MERRRRIVKVTRRGQTTIPIEFRKRHRIEDGAVLVIEDRGDSLVVRPLPKLEDLGGSLAKYASVEDLKRELDRTRAEED